MKHTHEITYVISNWEAFYPLIPRQTVDGDWIWLKKAYRRRVMVYTGFVDEPEWQYGTIVDLLRNSGNAPS